MRARPPSSRFWRARAWLGLACALSAWWASPITAHAFSEPRSYFDVPENGGGGGRWFTGSPAEGYDCTICHASTRSEPLQIVGLPEAGYTPGASYDVTLTWPAFAQRAHAIRAAQGMAEPSMGIIAELVAETGIGAGTIEIPAADQAMLSEQCEFPPGKQATQLFEVRPDEPTAQRAPKCEASLLGQRCVIAVLPCGAGQTRFRWTAPPDWQGPIWFSGGFVATDALSGSPAGDAFTEIAKPILPAASQAEHYETELEAGCSAAPLGRAPQTRAWPALGIIGLALLARRRRAR